MFFEDEQQCTILKALADENRLRVIRLIYREELNVQELCYCLDLAQSRVSRHLSVLKAAELVTDRRQGTKAYYSLTPATGSLQHLSEYIKNIGTSEHPDLEQLEACLRNRLLTKGEATDAAAWDEAVADLYNPLTALPALANMAPRGLTVADLGTGTGMMLPVLSQFAQKVYAIDYSPEMLKFARNRCRDHQIDNIRFIMSPLGQISEQLPPCDAMLMHFVIHQLVNPALIFSEAKKCLKPGGRLVIIDRTTHQDESAKKTFGSIWMGFEETQLTQWLTEAGFTQINWHTNPGLKTPVPVFTVSAQV